MTVISEDYDNREGGGGRGGTCAFCCIYVMQFVGYRGDKLVLLSVFCIAAEFGDGGMLMK